MKLRYVMLAACALVAVGSARASGDGINAIRSAFPFAIDGDPVEQAYVGAEWSVPFRVMEPESKEVNGLYLVPDRKFTGCETKVCFFTDPSNITGCVIAPFPADVPPQSDEKVEFHFRPKGEVVFCIAVDMDGKAAVSAYLGETLKAANWEPKGVKAAVRVGKNSAIVEFSVPRASFGKGSVAEVWRCNVIRRGASCGGLSSLAPTNRELPDPERFVRLGLGEVKSEKALPPLQENISKKVFLWNGDIWGDILPNATPPLHEKETSRIAFSGYRGTRAACALRVSNLSERPALYNVNVVSGSKSFVSRIRIREMGYLELRGGETIPDPIFDLPIDSVLRISPRSTAILWIDADCTGLEPRKHSAKVLMTPGYSGFKAKRFELELRVNTPDLGEMDIPVFFYTQSHRTQAAPISAEYDFNVLTIAPHVHYPPADASGRIDFSELDAKIDAFVKAGLRKEKIRIMLYSMFPKWAGFKTADGRFLKYLEPEWKVEYGKRIKAVVAHLRERHGIGYDRLILSTLDEPKGNPSDPATKGWAAITGADYIRSVDPKIRLFCNPWANEPEYLQQYLDRYDILEPYLRRMLNGTEDPDIAKRYVASGKEIWSYTIYVKQNTPHQYRRVFWGNLANGFGGCASVYGLTACTGDPFDSYDTSKGGASASDYNCAYRNPRTGSIAPSRRLEAWYQGLVDFKIVKWCRQRIAERTAKGEDLSKVKSGLDSLVKEADSPHCDYVKIRARLSAIAESLAGSRKD